VTPINKIRVIDDIRVIEKPDVEKGGRAKSSDINCNRLFHDTKEQRHQTHHL